MELHLRLAGGSRTSVLSQQLLLDEGRDGRELNELLSQRKRESDGEPHRRSRGRNNEDRRVQQRAMR